MTAFPMRLVLLIGAAGFFGSLLRWIMTKSVNSLFPDFPWGTYAVNVLGAFAAGFFFLLCRTRFQQYEAYFPVLFIGFLGAFTTFSTFALESSRFLLDAQYGKFVLNVMLQNVSGILAACGGILFAGYLFK